jgi:hypothetical protein
LDVRAYDTSWGEISLASVSPGDIVRFSVRANTSNATVNKARFTVNGISYETVKTRTGGSSDWEYYEDIEIPQIPDGETSLTITVKGELYSPSGNIGWF